MDVKLSGMYAYFCFFRVSEFAALLELLLSLMLDFLEPYDAVLLVTLPLLLLPPVPVLLVVLVLEIERLLLLLKNENMLPITYSSHTDKNPPNERDLFIA